MDHAGASSSVSCDACAENVVGVGGCAILDEHRPFSGRASVARRGKAFVREVVMGQVYCYYLFVLPPFSMSLQVFYAS